jgi:hypothetical protein
VYFADTVDIEELGWDRFISSAWEAIFVDYRSTAGIRSICRRWSDLLQAGRARRPGSRHRELRGFLRENFLGPDDLLGPDGTSA